MARQRNPERIKSFERYIEAKGKVTITELAKLANVSEAQIRKWKSQDKWDSILKDTPKRKGGQPGNSNATGKTPKKDGNKNAVTHGIYSKIGYGDLQDKELAERIKELKPTSELLIAEEIKSLLLKAAYLEEELHKYNKSDDNKFYTDKIVEMLAPKQKNDDLVQDDTLLSDNTNKEKEFKVTVKSVVKSSAFERAMKVEAELNKTHGRIIKLIDTMKSREFEERRLKLEEDKLELEKRKLSGVLESDEPDDEGAIDVDDI